MLLRIINLRPKTIPHIVVESIVWYPWEGIIGSKKVTKQISAIIILTRSRN